MTRDPVRALNIAVLVVQRTWHYLGGLFRLPGASVVGEHVAGSVLARLLVPEARSTAKDVSTQRADEREPLSADRAVTAMAVGSATVLGGLTRHRPVLTAVLVALLCTGVAAAATPAVTATLGAVTITLAVGMAIDAIRRLLARLVPG